MTEQKTARIIIGVYAGLIPQKAEPEFTREYALTSDQWQEATENGTQGQVLSELNGKAQGYAAWLMMQPDRLNWVRTDWIWL